MLNLQTAPSALRKIAADYLDELFVDALYNSSMVELMQSYGEFVLTGYYTGGRASALFYGVDTNSIQFDSKEKDMDVAINASYEWKIKSQQLQATQFILLQETYPLEQREKTQKQ